MSLPLSTSPDIIMARLSYTLLEILSPADQTSSGLQDPIQVAFGNEVGSMILNL